MVFPNGDDTKLETQPSVEGQPPAPSQSTQPEYVTKEQLEAFANELKGTFQQAYRGVQSVGDSSVSQMKKIQQEIAKSIEGFPGATPQQIQEFSRNKAIESLFEQQQPAQPGNVPGQGQPAPAGANGTQPTPEPQSASLVDAEADRMVKQFGFDIDDADPELEIIRKANTPTSTPFDYLTAYNQALTAKAERQKKTIPGRMPAMASGISAPSNDIANITNTDELFELAKRAGRI